MRLFAAGGAVLFAACFTVDEEQEECWPREPVEIDPLGERFTYVVDSVDMPSTATEATRFGLDLDCEGQGRPDNAFGQILSTVFSFVGSDLDDRVQVGIDAGRILHLLELQATSLEHAAGAGVWMFLGGDRDGDPSDNFSGSESFAIEDGHPTEPLTGTILEGRLVAQLGAVPLRVALPHVEDTFVLHLDVAHIEATVTADGIDGRLGGAMTEHEVDTTLLPIIHASLSGSVEKDCLEGTCQPDSHGEMFLDLFDEDYDGEIGLQELKENSLITSLFAPDVDLFDEDGTFCPRTDGVKDSLSVGVAFTAVPARF